MTVLVVVGDDGRLVGMNDGSGGGGDDKDSKGGVNNECK